MLYMLLFGITFLTTGFIIIYKGAFACKYQVLNYVFFFVTSLIITSFNWSSNKLENDVLSLIALFIIGLIHRYLNPKAVYIIFNIKSYDLMDILSEILKKQNINYNAYDDTILLDLLDTKIIKVKPIIPSLNILSLSGIDNTDLHTAIEDNLDFSLNQMTHKIIPLFGTIVFSIGLISTILFYAAIIN